MNQEKREEILDQVKDIVNHFFDDVEDNKQKDTMVIISIEKNNDDWYISSDLVDLDKR